MAKHYQKRPSEILGIDNDYLAYIFDEAALFLESVATDKEGRVNWNKIKWADSKKKSNEDLMEFIQQYQK